MMDGHLDLGRHVSEQKIVPMHLRVSRVSSPRAALSALVYDSVDSWGGLS